jgi:hypothetical protein
MLKHMILSMHLGSVYRVAHHRNRLVSKDAFHQRMCKKVLGIPRFSANGVAELE